MTLPRQVTRHHDAEITDLGDKWECGKKGREHYRVAFSTSLAYTYRSLHVNYKQFQV